MVDAPSSLDPSPWLADSLQLLQTSIPEPAWTMKAVSQIFGESAAGVDLHPWGITLDIDARRVPIAIARFKLPASDLDLVDAGGIKPVYAGASTIVTLKVGWKRSGSADVQTVFRGWITEITVENGVASCVAQTMDSVLDSKALSTYEVPDTYTTVAQVFSDVTSNWGVILSPWTTNVIGALPTPTSGQLAGFRSLNLGGGSYYDGLSAAALALGQWLRGSLVGPGWLDLSARYDGGAALNLDPFVDADSILTRHSIDDFATSIVLTAVWGEGTNQKSSKLGFGTSQGWSSVTYGFEAGIIKEITANYRPPGGVLASNDPIGNAYAQAYGSRVWRHQATGRAVWWLRPRSIVSFGGKTGQVDALNFDVDAGTMTVAIRPTSAY